MQLSELKDLISERNNISFHNVLSKQLTLIGDVSFKNKIGDCTFITITTPIEFNADADVNAKTDNFFIEVYAYKYDQEITTDDKIEVTGKLQIFKGKFQIKADNIKVLGKGNLWKLKTEWNKQINSMKKNFEKETVELISPLNLAVITPENSAGFKDFEYIITKRKDDRKHNITAFYTTFSAKNIIEKIIEVNELNEINESNEYDLICIVRGGDLKGNLDLIFNNPEVCRAIIESQLPILLAVGHEPDKFFASLFVYQTCITPTAGAKYLNQLFYNKTQTKEPIDLLRNKLDVSQSENDDLRSDILMLKIDIKDKKDQIIFLRKNNSEKDKRIADLEAEIERLKKLLSNNNNPKGIFEKIKNIFS